MVLIAHTLQMEHLVLNRFRTISFYRCTLICLMLLYSQKFCVIYSADEGMAFLDRRDLKWLSCVSTIFLHNFKYTLQQGRELETKKN